MKSGPAIFLACPVFADGLRDGEDVGFREGAVQRRAAMSAGAEADQLIGIGGVRLVIEIIAFELGDIDEDLRGRGLSCQRVDGHNCNYFRAWSRKLIGGK